MNDDAIKRLANLDLNDPNARAIMAKICVPSATGASGAQLGVEKPWKVKYPSSKGKKPVSSDEAVRRYREKVASGEPAYPPVEQPDAQIGGNGPDDLDPFTNDAAGVPPKDAGSSDQAQEEAQDRSKRRPRRPSKASDASLGEALLAALAGIADLKRDREQPQVQPVPLCSTELQDYKSRKKTVRLKLSNGQVTMQCLSVVQEEYSVTVVMDSDANGFMFVPESGTEVTVSWDGRSLKTYYPGAQFTIKELGLTGLVFLADPNQEAPESASQPSRGQERTSAPEKVAPPPQPSKFKFNPESGLEEDEFGLTRV